MAEFNEKLHPRAPKGSENGGEFIDKNTLVLKLIKENKSVIINSIKEAFSVDDNKASEILSSFQEYIINNPNINISELIKSRQLDVDLKMIVNRFERGYNGLGTSNLKVVSETEKAIQFEVGFKFSENKPTVVYGVDGNENLNTGYIVTAWVPKSIIVNNKIPMWFVKKDIYSKFGRININDKVYNINP